MSKHKTTPTGKDYRRGGFFVKKVAFAFWDLRDGLRTVGADLPRKIPYLHVFRRRDLRGGDLALL
jgi:hypothetical protein